jgi:hypothetical protein
MNRFDDRPGPSRMGPIVLVAAYVCMFALLINLFARIGWIHVRLPFLTGSSARWGWALGAVVCFVFAWYAERGSRGRPT